MLSCPYNHSPTCHIRLVFKLSIGTTHTSNWMPLELTSNLSHMRTNFCLRRVRRSNQLESFFALCFFSLFLSLCVRLAPAAVEIVADTRIESKFFERRRRPSTFERITSSKFKQCHSFVFFFVLVWQLLAAKVQLFLLSTSKQISLDQLVLQFNQVIRRVLLQHTFSPPPSSSFCPTKSFKPKRRKKNEIEIHFQKVTCARRSFGSISLACFAAAYFVLTWSPAIPQL